MTQEVDFHELINKGNTTIDELFGNRTFESLIQYGNLNETIFNFLISEETIKRILDLLFVIPATKSEKIPLRRMNSISKIFFVQNQTNKKIVASYLKSDLFVETVVNFPKSEYGFNEKCSGYFSTVLNALYVNTNGAILTKIPYLKEFLTNGVRNTGYLALLSNCLVTYHNNIGIDAEFVIQLISNISNENGFYVCMALMDTLNKSYLNNILCRPEIISYLLDKGVCDHLSASVKIYIFKLLKKLNRYIKKIRDVEQFLNNKMLEISLETQPQNVIGSALTFINTQSDKLILMIFDKNVLSSVKVGIVKSIKNYPTELLPGFFARTDFISLLVKAFETISMRFFVSSIVDTLTSTEINFDHFKTEEWRDFLQKVNSYKQIFPVEEHVSEEYSDVSQEMESMLDYENDDNLFDSDENSSDNLCDVPATKSCTLPRPPDDFFTNFSSQSTTIIQKDLDSPKGEPFDGDLPPAPELPLEQFMMEQMDQLDSDESDDEILPDMSRRGSKSFFDRGGSMRSSGRDFYSSRRGTSYRSGGRNSRSHDRSNSYNSEMDEQCSSDSQDDSDPAIPDYISSSDNREAIHKYIYDKVVTPFVTQTIGSILSRL